MLFQHERGANGPGTRSASTASGGASTTPCRSRAKPERKPNNYLNQLGQWSRGTEEDHEICQWPGTKSDDDYLGQWNAIL
jgi:hypothetical protein